MSRSSTPRRILVAALVLGAATAFPGPVTTADSPGQACDQPTRRTTLYAERLPDSPSGQIRLGWGLTPDSASIPGPPLEMIEGECMAITVVNDVPADALRALRDGPLGCGPDCELPLGVSLHVHGVKYTQASDGTIQTNSWVPPGESRTYKWYAAPRVSVAGRVVSLGTAGYWWYHDHVVGTDHGTGGLYSGLAGGLIVRRPGDLKPDRIYTTIFGPDQTINFRRYEPGNPERSLDNCEFTGWKPSPTCFVARQGERVEFLAIGVGDEFHTFHLHGHNWANNRTGILSSQLDETPLIDNRTLGPADSFGFQIIAGETVGAGKWMLHCHVQLHSDRGMVTFFNVLPGSAVPGQAATMPSQPHAHYGRQSSPQG